MKKTSIIVLFLVFVFCFSSCGRTTISGSVSQAEEENAQIIEEQKERTAVIAVSNEEMHYECAQCGGNCSFFTGYFRCPVINSASPDAEMINEEIKTNYDKYLTAAKEVGESGLAYGFDFSTAYAGNQYVILRTAIETVLLHSGGTYSYGFYYYDIINDCVADISDVCASFGLDADIIAAYLRVELSEDEKYEADSIAGITPDCIDIYPAGDSSWYVRVQNDRLKYETQITSSDLNLRGEEIASLLEREAAEAESASLAEAESEEEDTDEQDVIYYDDDDSYDYYDYYGYYGYYGY